LSRSLKEYREALERARADHQKKVTELRVNEEEGKRLQAKLKEMGYESWKALEEGLSRDEEEIARLQKELDERLAPYLKAHP